VKDVLRIAQPGRRILAVFCGCARGYIYALGEGFSSNGGIVREFARVRSERKGSPHARMGHMVRSPVSLTLLEFTPRARGGAAFHWDAFHFWGE
jgi:hypothetical protein